MAKTTSFPIIASVALLALGGDAQLEFQIIPFPSWSLTAIATADWPAAIPIHARPRIEHHSPQ
jgi:hypothetical protein